MNAGELINLPLLKATVGAWATLSEGTEWLIAVHRSGQIHFFLPVDLTVLNSCIVPIPDGCEIDF